VRLLIWREEILVFFSGLNQFPPKDGVPCRRVLPGFIDYPLSQCAGHIPAHLMGYTYLHKHLAVSASCQVKGKEISTSLAAYFTIMR
jgi:hypothetical protein